MKINTDSEFYNSEDGYIRSSSLKPFHGCSWLYYAQNILKLPSDSNNDGARKGAVCHSVFESLLNPRHRRHFDRIIEADGIKGNHRENSVVLEWVWKLMARNGLPESDAIFNQINDMIMVGLKADFFVEGAEIIGAEHRFKYRNMAPKYYIIGTMDKIATKPQDVIIVDYKSSKQKYKGEDKECNMQALLYSLYATKKWPGKKPIVRFIFLQFPNDPILEVKFDDNTLKGFEYYLEATSNQMEVFTEEDALFNLAAYQGMPKDGSFSGKLLCGFSKYPGQLKKDGTVMYGCPAKWKLKYYIIKDKDGKWINSIKNKENYLLQEGENIEEIVYPGCPCFQNKFI